MTSEIRANTLKNRVGLGTVSFTNTGPVVSGIVTIANSTSEGVTLEDNAGVGNSLKITTPTGYVSIGSGNSTFVHLQTDRGVFYFQKRIFVDEGIIGSYDENLTLQSPSNTTRMTINKDTGLVSIVNDLDVDGHTNLDNVSIAGVTTFSNNVKFDGATAGRDVTFIRSSNTLEFATNAILELGNGGSGDCRLFNNGTDTRIINGDGTLKFESDTYEFKDKDNTTSYLNITSGGQVSISGAGTTFGNNTLLNIAPANRTTAFDASDGDTWHDVVIKQGASATTNSVGIAFEVSPSAYHKNAGTGIVVIKDGNNFDYGTHLAFVTRPHTAVAEERVRITSDGRVGINETTVDTQLHVSGNANAQTTAGAGTNTAIRITDTDTSAQSGQIYGEIQFETRDVNSAGVAAYLTAQGNSSGQASMMFGTGAGGSASTKMVLHHTGNASLGTEVPNEYANQTTFTINGTTYGRLDLEVAGTLRGSIWANSGGLGIDAGANDIEMFTGSQQRVKINTSGQMGIGQGFSPSRHLDIKDSTGANRIVNIRGTGTSGAFLAFLDANTTDDSKCRVGSIGGNNLGLRGDTHSFQDGNGNDKVHIDSSGRMLLGTQRTLGSARYYDDITVNNSNNTSGEAGGTGLTLISGSSSWNAILFADNTSDSQNAGFIKYSHSGDFMQFATAGVERFKISSVGITKATNPSFHARPPGNYTLNNGDTIVGGTWSTNNSESFVRGTLSDGTTSIWDNSTGIFTVPVAGIYFLHWTVFLANNTTRRDAMIYLNGTGGGNIIARTEIGDAADTTGTNKNVSVTTVVSLSANDQIRFGCRPTGGNNIYTSAKPWSYACGYLVG